MKQSGEIRARSCHVSVKSPTLGIKPEFVCSSASAFAGLKVQQALALLDANLGERLTLARIASRLEVSPYYLAHVFKRTVGIAPHRYLIRRRVERAKQLLQKTDLPIAHVALAVGCANQSHFSALFRGVTGVTPQSYRADR